MDGVHLQAEHLPERRGRRLHKIAKQGLQLRFGLLHGRAGFHPAEHTDHRSHHVPLHDRFVEGFRDNQVGMGERRIFEITRKHANDLRRLAIDGHYPANHVSISGEPVLPQVVA